MKREKIGKVTLDYTYYPGEDRYTDGAIEDEMLSIAKEYREEAFPEIIQEKKSWPILYHFSHVRENIIDWLPMTGRERVLEIGAGPGAITGTLAKKAAQVTCIDLSRKRCRINAWRHRDCENLKFLVGNFQDIEENLEETFDLITLIGVFEYAQFSIQSENPFADYLARIRRHLTPQGRLVIAIENRLGLKYWAGATEDHTGLYFEGLEGYPTTDYVRTFSKQELEGVMREAGLAEFEFFYPYPDYKLPDRIYSDRHLPKKGELNHNRQNFDRERIQVFQEERVFDSLLASGLFQEFSNSFLVVARNAGAADAEQKNAESFLYTKYSNERREELRIRTDLLINENGEKCIRKVAASAQAWKHVEAIYERSLWLTREFRGTGLAVNECRICRGGVCFPFLKGRTLEEKLDEFLEKKKVSEAAAEIERYFRMFYPKHMQQSREMTEDEAQNWAKEAGLARFTVTPEFQKVFGEVDFTEPQYCRAVSDIDMIFSNAIENGDGYELIDYEWTFDFPIPVKYPVYRCIYYYLEGSSKRDALRQEDLYSRFGISGQECVQFARMEQGFQQYILGSYTPAWKQYDDISEGVIELAPLMNEIRENKKLQTVEVYFDDGRGFGVWNWKKFCLQEAVERALEIELPPGTKQVRLDPCSCRSIVRIRELSQNGKRLKFISNGRTAPGGELIFDTEDPQIIFSVESDGPIRAVFLAERMSGLGRELILGQQGRVEWMEQTKVWKLYKRMKGMRKKQG